MAKVSFQKLKKWGGKKGFGVSTGAGETKEGLIEKLVEVMSDNMDELDEEQLAWLEDQTGGGKKKKSKKTKKTKKEKKSKKEKATPKEKKEKKTKKKKKEKEEEEEEVKTDVEPSDLRKFAKELDISTKGWKKWDEDEWEACANEIYSTVDDMSDDEKEELSEELFAWYATVKGVEEDKAEEEPAPKAKKVKPPSKVKLKRWAAAIDVDIEDKDPEEIVAEILEEFEDLDDEDKAELPDTLVEWAEAALGGGEEEEEEEVELPDYKTLKGFAKEVGLKLKDIKKVKDDSKALVEMIAEAYDADDEDEYSDELNEFVSGLGGKEEDEVETDVEEEPEEEEEPEDPSDQIKEWLGEAGYDVDDFDGWDADELVEKLAEDYQDEDDRDDLPEDSIEFLQAVKPELFEKKKSVKKKKKKKKK